MKRVYVDMVGDLFHVGHINMLKQARSYGDCLIVGIHSDKTVESYKRTPILSEKERYEIVRNCKLVDEVITDAPLVITKDYIKENKIDFVIHGDDTNVLFNEQHKIPLEMGIMKYVKYTKGISTSEIIKRIKNDKV
jgi:cytidyltransferase-like protein